MCDFGITEIAVASLAVSALSAGASIMGQMQQQKAQSTYQSELVVANQKQMAENAQIANTSYTSQAAQENVGLAEQSESNAVSNQDMAIKRLQAQGELMAGAGGAGVEGSSLDTLMADFHRQEDMFRQHNDQNLLFKQQQTGADIVGLRNTAAARISSVKPYIPSPIAPVDYAGPLLSVAGTGVQMGALKYTSQQKALKGA